MTISQLNKKVDVLSRNNIQQQNEKNSLIELLKLVKRGIDDQSITFSNKSMVTNKIKKKNLNETFR